MKLSIPSFPNGGPIPGDYAFCIPAEEGHVTFGPNRNPHLQWHDAPAETKSFAIICVDPDAPNDPRDVNQDGKTIPADFPRAEFIHWVLVDIPASATALPEGLDSMGVTPKGKPATRQKYGLRGINDYTGWFKGNADMEGVYGGYDGPCPPWNDERIHHYFFRLYALDVPTLGLSGDFTAAEAINAMGDHIIDRAEWFGTYTLNPNLM